MKFLSSPKLLYHLYVFGLILVALIWSTTYAISSNVMQITHPITLIFYRFGIAVSILSFHLIWKKKKLLKQAKIGFGLGVLLFAFYAFHNFGISLTSVNKASFVIGLFIVFVPFLSRIILHRKIKLQEFLSLLVASLSIWIITGGINGFNLGDWLCLLSAIIYAFYIVIVSKFASKEDPLVEVWQQFVVLTLLSGVAIIIFQLPLGFGNNLWEILYLAVLPTLTCFLIVNSSEKYVDAFLVAMLISLDTVLSPLSTNVISHVPIENSVVIGGLLFIVAIILVNLRGKIRQ
jgi:drug/metabolite transporter (DMT)-like permease